MERAWIMDTPVVMPEGGLPVGKDRVFILDRNEACYYFTGGKDR